MIQHVLKREKTFGIKLFMHLGFLCYALSAYGTGISSADHKNFISLSTGLSSHAIQDVTISPFVYKGLQMPIWLQYEHRGASRIHSVSIFYDRLDLQSKITNKKSYFSHHTDNTNAFVGYSLLYKIYSCNKLTAEIYGGGRFKSYINYRNHYYTKKDQATTAEQSTGIDIHVRAYKKYNSRNDLLTCGINLPLISYVIMGDMYNANVCDPVFDLDPNGNLLLQFITNGNVFFINRLFEFQSDLGITRSISRHLILGVEHRLHYYLYKKHPDNRPTRYLNSQVLFAMVINL